ncbi:bifunctional folylpolyglutamate synthase/dihydrofolate synthase [Planctomicrobium sp. SH527]|uniref:bifunctional folylpolyglutamate synthase/dihydrofolate synthase n=1 Tax=Planctomicrobium sp. SH527 TaxID=3448123 RepID=UPI003F5C3D60
MNQPSPAVAVRYQQSLDFIFGRLNYERAPEAARSLQDFKLTRMEEFLAALRNPQRSVPTVHVAGSKGKGSTATMVARIAQAAGYQVGLFTSPHVDAFEERFTINSRVPTAEQLIALTDRVRPIVAEFDRRSSGEGVTFFEIATAIGWLFFQESGVDLAVIEVGLGGRLDSTNVCNPLVTAITSISRDHTRLLGETLALIAGEKAGIIKTGVPVVTAVTDSEPANVIVERAREKNAPLFRLNQEFRIENSSPQATGGSVPACYRFDFVSGEYALRDVRLAMAGEHQTRNAAIAITVATLLREQGFVLTDDQIRAGLAATLCPLRVEVVDQTPLTIIDGAHNAASIVALCETLRSVPSERRIVIFSTSRDKEVSVLLKTLDGFFDEIWLTQYSNNPRTVTLAELEALAPQVLTKPWRILQNPAAALNEAAATTTSQDLVCVTGSFFLAAEAKAILVNGLKPLRN